VKRSIALNWVHAADAVLGGVVDAATRLTGPLASVNARLAELMLRPVYALYTRRLRGEVLDSARPGHVAVIMDGNRRWAVSQGFDDIGEGHRRGAEKALEVVDWCAELGIREVTLWALSLENLGRPADEVDVIADVATESLTAMVEGRRRTRVPIRLKVIGRRDPLPERLRQAVEASSGLSRADAGLDVTVALAYSGRDELIEAAQATVRELAASGVAAAEIAGHLTADALAAHLYTRGSSDPDLIIRTSGEVRLSGFLPWQSVYSEYYFCDAYWPAFREIDFLRAIRTYQQRARRFGQ
jgi:short-chain Z-isoprenyl diphosphate synthase